MSKRNIGIYGEFMRPFDIKVGDEVKIHSFDLGHSDNTVIAKINKVTKCYVYTDDAYYTKFNIYTLEKSPKVNDYYANIISINGISIEKLLKNM